MSMLTEVPLEPAIPLFVVFWSLVVIVSFTVVGLLVKALWRRFR